MLLISRESLVKALKNMQFIDSNNEYSNGWDSAINTVLNHISAEPTINIDPDDVIAMCDYMSSKCSETNEQGRPLGDVNTATVKAYCNAIADSMEGIKR